MSYMYIPRLIFFFFVIIKSDMVKEYCKNDFEASCAAPDEVLIIKNATFGVNGLGHCFSTTDGNVCLNDVTNRMNKQCLGKRSCSMSDYRKELESYKKCQKYISDILKVVYHCQKIERAACVSCSKKKMAKVTETSGYLASTFKDSCGTPSCPWLIQGTAGQKVNISIYDYSSYDTKKQQNGYTKDVKLFSIKDKIHFKDHTVYKKDTTNYVQHVHTSLHNQVLLSVHAQHPFLIHYKVFGCQDPVLKKGWKVERMGDNLKLGCEYSSDIQWSQVCIDNEWKGQLGTCDEESSSGAFFGSSLSEFFTALPFSVVVAAVVSVAVILCVCILTIGLVFFRRSNGSNHRKASSMADQYVDINDPNSSLVQKMMATERKKNKQMTAQRENKYALNHAVATSGGRPLPSIPLTGVEGPPRMMIRSYGEVGKRQSGGNKYYCIEQQDLDLFPPPPELLNPSSTTSSNNNQHANNISNNLPYHNNNMGPKVSNHVSNTYENQQAIMGTMATAGITAAAHASSQLLNKQPASQAAISSPLNI